MSECYNAGSTEDLSMFNRDSSNFGRATLPTTDTSTVNSGTDDAKWFRNRVVGAAPLNSTVIRPTTNYGVRYVTLKYQTIREPEQLHAGYTSPTAEFDSVDAISTTNLPGSTVTRRAGTSQFSMAEQHDTFDYTQHRTDNQMQPSSWIFFDYSGI